MIPRHHHQGVRNQGEFFKAAAKAVVNNAGEGQMGSTTRDNGGALHLDPAQISKLLWACVSLGYAPGGRGSAPGILTHSHTVVDNQSANNDFIDQSETQLLFQLISKRLSGQGGTAGFHAKEAARTAAALSEAGISTPGLYAALGRVVMRQRLELT